MIINFPTGFSENTVKHVLRGHILDKEKIE